MLTNAMQASRTLARRQTRATVSQALAASLACPGTELHLTFQPNFHSVQRQKPIKLFPSAKTRQVRPTNEKLEKTTQRVNFLEMTLDPSKKLPFSIPADSWVHSKIGNTPLLHIEDNIYAKMEGSNPSGSLKDRTVGAGILRMLQSGELSRGDTLCIVTSGSAGVASAALHQAITAVTGFELRVVVVMPKAYAKKATPAKIIAREGMQTFTSSAEILADHAKATPGSEQFNKCQVLLLDGVFMECLEETKQIMVTDGWKMLDQHFSTDFMHGHASTALELMAQNPDLTDVVVSTGTGATAAGLRKFLPEHVNVHARPAKSGSIDGIADVRRYGNYCDPASLKGYFDGDFDTEQAFALAETLKKEHNIAAGPSSGACWWLAKQIQAKSPQAQIAFISADGKTVE